MGQAIRFMKNDKFSDTLSQKDLNLMRRIHKAYDNPNSYYTKINELGLPYLKNPRKTNEFDKVVNYQKHQNVSDLLPVKKD